jgi:hypothetical protein
VLITIAFLDPGKVKKQVFSVDNENSKEVNISVFTQDLNGGFDVSE